MEGEFGALTGKGLEILAAMPVNGGKYYGISIELPREQVGTLIGRLMPYADLRSAYLGYMGNGKGIQQLCRQDEELIVAKLEIKSHEGMDEGTTATISLYPRSANGEKIVNLIGREFLPGMYASIQRSIKSEKNPDARLLKLA